MFICKAHLSPLIIMKRRPGQAAMLENFMVGLINPCLCARRFVRDLQKCTCFPTYDST